MDFNNLGIFSESYELDQADAPGIVKRSKARKRFLLKMFSIREMLKWKYNYFEVVPKEHRMFMAVKKKLKVYYKSLKFKRSWRTLMDDLYHKETLAANKFLLNLELKKLNKKTSPSSVEDPIKLLANYDNEVLNMIRRIKDEYRFYLKFPKCYPNHDVELRNCIIDRVAGLEGFNDIEMNVDEEFEAYWQDRISVLCEDKIIAEKKEIRKNWKNLLPAYLTSGDNACPEELKQLMFSDDEDGEDDLN